MRISVCRPGELDADELGLWASFQGRDPQLQNPFLSAAFARAVDAVDERTRVAVIEDGGAIVGYLPFTSRGRALAASLAPGIASAQALLHDPQAEIEVDELLRDSHLAIIEVDHFVANGVGDSHNAHLVDRPTKVIDISAGFDAFLADLRTRRARHASWARRKAQQIESEFGTLTFSTGVRDRAALEKVIAWKSAQYRQSGWRDPFARRWLVELCHRLLETDEPGLFGRLSTLSVNDTLLAGDFSPHSESIYAAWFIAYNPDFSRYSPGALNALRVVETCASLGISLVDLGTGDEEFKQVLSTGTQPLVEGFLSRRHPRALVRRAARYPRTKTVAFILGHPKVRARVRSTLRHLGSLRGARRA
jgi:CelD/BcsL family acetyltransferase involved in cellulose biosynthesis